VLDILQGPYAELATILAVVVALELFFKLLAVPLAVTTVQLETRFTPAKLVAARGPLPLSTCQLIVAAEALPARAASKMANALVTKARPSFVLECLWIVRVFIGLAIYFIDRSRLEWIGERRIFGSLDTG
jgi:hypothetical protein